MVVCAVDDKGNDLVVFDPAGVFLDVDNSNSHQQRFRIFGQQKLKEAGLSLQQDKRGNGVDYLTYKGGMLDIIPLETNHGIVTLRTKKLTLTKDQLKLPCADHNKGNGYSKWGDNCRFSHDGPKGGKRKHTSLAVKGTAKKQKKAMMSMLVKVLEEAAEPDNEPKEKQASAKERLR